MKNIIVLDIETQRLFSDAWRYAWLLLDTRRTKPRLRGEISNEDPDAQPPREVRPRKVAPWLSLLPKPVNSIEALIEFALYDLRIPRVHPYFLFGYDPYWREVDLNLYDQDAVYRGSPFFNRRLGLAVAVTWDAKYGFREWWEDKALDLVEELARHRVIVGANLVKYDYGILERYVPDVRKRLAFRTIDILAHARWGLFLTFIQSQLRKSNKRTSKTAIEELATRHQLYPAQPYSWGKYDLDEDFWCLAPGEYKTSIPGYRVSLARLAKGTLNARKLDKGTNAPALFAKRKYANSEALFRSRRIALQGTGSNLAGET